MELSQQASRNAAADDDGADGRGAHGPGGEPAGWLPPALSALLESSIRRGCRTAAPSGAVRPAAVGHQLGAGRFRPAATVRAPLPPQPGAKDYLPHPPPPAPARKITPYRKVRYLFHARPEVILEKSKRFAKGALEHYNKGKKIKFELMDVKPVNMMPEEYLCYTHVNFTARSSKEGSKEQLFFAELENSGRRRASCRFIVTCCEPLGSDSTVGHKGYQLDDDTSAVKDNVDSTYCFACDSRMSHPRG